MKKMILSALILILVLFLSLSVTAKGVDTDVIKLNISSQDLLPDKNQPLNQSLQQPLQLIFIPKVTESFNNTDLDKTKLLKASVSSQVNENKGLWKSWNYIKGKPGDNNIGLGMFSYHTMKNKDQLNDSNKLLAVDYDGYILGTYYNSYHVQTYYAGITRKLYEKHLPQDIDMDLKYKVMALRGYKYYEFNVGGFTPLIVPVIGFSKGYVGVDFLISPGKTLTFATAFRINLKNKQ